ncbi:transglycosylase domain-containing protein [Pseudokineococcus basanitobsidens]|uniref:Transglycosylase domain-containing protein n=1 Tax=Pseudokineococcus basanitobsidens TaxID=1926649 RepID=A0ABU8RK53_9ACTN
MAGDSSSPSGATGPRDTRPTDDHPTEDRPVGRRRGSIAFAAARRPAGSAGSVGAGLATLVGGGVVAGLLVAGLAVPVVATAGAGADAAVETFEDLPTQLDPSALPIRSTIRYADGTPMTGFYSENRVLVPLDAVAPVMRDAVIAIEDSRFYEHGGADPRGITRAFFNNLAGRATQGASTLTQQWIKNVLLQQAREADDQEAIDALTSPNEARKVREIRLAIAAEEDYSKDEILGNYLNIALFGANTYGVEAASEYYFSKPASELELVDAALLAGMIQNPSLYEPTQNPEGAQERRDVVLARMLELGKIDQAQHDAAEAVPVGDQLRINPPDNGCSPAGASAYFCDYAVHTILQDPAFGEDRDARVRALYRGGIDVTTTLQPPRQKEAWDAVRDTVPVDDRSQVGATIVSVEPGTGKVRAMAQNRIYTTAPTDERGYTNINYNVDQSLGGGRGFQPGSNWKPFTLATWLKEGKTLRETVAAAPVEKTFPASDFRACGNRLVDSWDVRNSEGSGTGRMSVLQATYDSVNTAYASMATELDLCDIRATAESLGAHPASPESVPAYQDGRLGVNPANVLGSDPVAPLTMAAAFATYASGGTYCPPRPLENAVDRDGQPIQPTVGSCTQPLGNDDYTSEEIANTVTYALENVFTRGTAERVGTPDGRPAAGKTGTTNKMVQTWFSGYTPQLATTAWVGHPDESGTSLSDETIDGVKRDVYGSTYAAPMWRDYMEEALDGLPEEDFGPPDWSLVGQSTSTSGSDDDEDSSDSSSQGQD